MLAQGEDIVPIPGTKRRCYLEENAASVNITITPTELAQIDALVPKDIAIGDRYTLSGMANVNI